MHGEWVTSPVSEDVTSPGMVMNNTPAQPVRHPTAPSQFRQPLPPTAPATSPVGVPGNRMRLSPSHPNALGQPVDGANTERMRLSMIQQQQQQKAQYQAQFGTPMDIQQQRMVHIARRVPQSPGGTVVPMQSPGGTPTAPPQPHPQHPQMMGHGGVPPPHMSPHHRHMQQQQHQQMMQQQFQQQQQVQMQAPYQQQQQQHPHQGQAFQQQQQPAPQMTPPQHIQHQPMSLPNSSTTDFELPESVTRELEQLEEEQQQKNEKQQLQNISQDGKLRVY